MMNDESKKSTRIAFVFDSSFIIPCIRDPARRAHPQTLVYASGSAGKPPPTPEGK
jgi:hypothetical protein